MASLVEFKPHRGDYDAVSDAGSDKDPADVTTALIGPGLALGQPEVRRRFWWSRAIAPNLDAIATQVMNGSTRRPSSSYLFADNPRA